MNLSRKYIHGSAKIWIAFLPDYESSLKTKEANLKIFAESSAFILRVCSLELWLFSVV